MLFNGESRPTRCIKLDIYCGELAELGARLQNRDIVLSRVRIVVIVPAQDKMQSVNFACFWVGMNGAKDLARLNNLENF